MVALDPDVRADAREALEKLATGQRDALDAASKNDPVAQIVLTLHRVPDHRKSVEKVLRHEDAALVRAAAEALGYVSPDASAKELLAVLRGEDLRAAMAAARSLSKSKIPAVRAAVQQVAEGIDNVHAKMVAVYAMELIAPGGRHRFARPII